MLLCGIGTIIYSLWLQKKWDESIAKFPLGPSPLIPWQVSNLHFLFTTRHIHENQQLLPAEINITRQMIQEIQAKGYSASDKPLFSVFRFIYTFLGAGIIVCLSAIGGYIIANCISNCTLCFASFLLSFSITRRTKEPLRFSKLHHFQGQFNHS